MEAVLATYGTLRSPAVRRRLGLDAMLVPRGPCRLRGRLVDLGTYPGLLPGRGTVVADLLALADPAAFAILDAYEGWDPRTPAASLFRRERATLDEPAGTRAWVYVYNRDPGAAPEVPGGDWRAHAERKSG